MPESLELELMNAPFSEAAFESDPERADSLDELEVGREEIDSDEEEI